MSLRSFFSALVIGLSLLFRPISASEHYIKEVFRLLAEESLLLNSKLNMEIIGCGGMFNGSIETLEVVAQLPAYVSMSKARLVFVAALREWLKRLNEDKYAQPYYKQYPLTLDNLELRLMTVDYDVKSTEESPKIVLIFNLDNQLVYCYRNSNGCLRVFFRESYADAIKKIEKEIVRPGVNPFKKNNE